MLAGCIYTNRRWDDLFDVPTSHPFSSPQHARFLRRINTRGSAEIEQERIEALLSEINAIRNFSLRNKHTKTKQLRRPRQKHHRLQAPFPVPHVFLPYTHFPRRNRRQNRGIHITHREKRPFLRLHEMDVGGQQRLLLRRPGELLFHHKHYTTNEETRIPAGVTSTTRTCWENAMLKMMSCSLEAIAASGRRSWRIWRKSGCAPGGISLPRFDRINRYCHLIF